MTKRVLSWLLGVLLVVSGSALQLHAQGLTGQVSGSVLDSSGSALPGATVTVKNAGTQISRETTTDQSGNFVLTELLAGTYEVTVALAGFKTAVQTGLVLSANERLALRAITLEVGAVSEVLTVTAEPARVQTQSAERSGLISQEQLKEVALKGRDYMGHLRLMPGVVDTANREAPGWNNLGGLSINGGRVNTINLTYDGVTNLDTGSNTGPFLAPGLDSIAEVKVLTSNYQAEYGRSSGGTINVITKSGSRQFRGGGFYSKRHESFNANEWFNNKLNRPKPIYRFDYTGWHLGGPVILPGFNSDRNKLFFFFNQEFLPRTNPGNLERRTMPTALERQGDFSQSFDSTGALIVIRDPQTGQPFPGNVIPAGRINRNGYNLLDMLPRATNFDRGFTLGNFNHSTQQNADNPKMNNIVRVDWRPTSNDSFYFTFKDWYSDQRGSEITAGPARWGFFNTHYLNTDRGGSVNYTRILRPNLIVDTDFGIRTQTEQFYPLTEGDWDRINRDNVGFDVGQFSPQLNPRNVIPKATFGLPNSPDFSYDNRLVDQGQGWITSIRSNLSWIKGRHSFKGGFYFEQSRNSEGNGGVGAGPWAGTFDFSSDVNNPLNANYAYANALLGNFRSYSEIDAFSEVEGYRYITEFYLQDTWKAASRLTVDYGVRFVNYTPWYSTLPAAEFVPEQWDPALAPRLYEPARSNGQNVAFDPVTGETKPNVFVGSFVPGTGDRYNGMVTSDDPGVPRGFRESQGLEAEPRLGVAWDIMGDQKMAMHASAGLYHNSFINANTLDALARNPPAQNTPSIFYSSFDTFLGAGAQGAFSNRPSGVFGLQRDAKTPKSYNYSIGIQRELGWGTVLDVTYAGAQTRNLEMQVDLNRVPDGARFVDLNPQNANPQNPASAKPAEFLRPYRGYQNIDIREHFGESSYNSLQVQLNRRYINGLQFAVAYTFGKTIGQNFNFNPARPGSAWNERPEASTQLHNLILNYTWDVPNGSRLMDNALGRGLLDGWQLSGDTAFVSGDWAGVNGPATTDNFDFTGGDQGTRVKLVGDPLCTSGNCDVTPGGGGSYFDGASFVRQERGDFGNAEAAFYRLPKIVVSNFSMFKNFGLGGSRKLQIRWEVYNVFNQVNWSALDLQARFNPQGEQVNAAFGQATAARAPRIMQGALRFSF